jgi:2-polyprenyl-6-methoxyphenol hydroxylase-like FAD-dependent oxidoreductase
VVIGGSIAGLLMASVLSDVFESVTVYDRDLLPDKAEPRRGVPQSRHAHALHGRGAEALGEVLPGFWDDMIDAGGVTGDAQVDVNWYLDGYQLAHAPSALTGMALTRPTIELLIRRRAAALPNIKIAECVDVTGLITSGGRVTGVRIRPSGRDALGDDPVDLPLPEPAEAEPVAADLVVDTAGRGSRAAIWLGELGFPVPRTSEVRADVSYVTRHYRSEPEQLGGMIGALVTPYPGLPRIGAAFRQEGSQWVVLLAGIVGEVPPTDDAGMLAFAESLAGPEIAEVVRTSAPLDEPAKRRFPASVRYHYEKLDRYLDGFLVAGDAICSFNPIYGQGMTIAALEAVALKHLIGGGDTADLPRRYFRTVGKLVSEAWTTSASGDLRFPEAEGKRGPADRFINAYLEHFRKAASVDPVLGAAFLRVANMIDSPTRLLSPGNAIRVFRSAGKAAPRVRQRQPGVTAPG